PDRAAAVGSALLDELNYPLGGRDDDDSSWPRRTQRIPDVTTTDTNPSTDATKKADAASSGLDTLCVPPASAATPTPAPTTSARSAANRCRAGRTMPMTPATTAPAPMKIEPHITVVSMQGASPSERRAVKGRNGNATLPPQGQPRA